MSAKVNQNQKQSIVLSCEIRNNSYFQLKKEGIVKSIRTYLPTLLSHYVDGLTCNQISDITKIKVQSLTNPLNVLSANGVLSSANCRYSLKTKRLNVVYQLPELKKLERTLFSELEIEQKND